MISSTHYSAETLRKVDRTGMFEIFRSVYERVQCLRVGYWLVLQ